MSGANKDKENNENAVEMIIPNRFYSVYSKPVYVDMEFVQTSPMKRLTKEQQWIRDLQIYKRQTTSQKKLQKHVMAHNQESTEHINEALDGIKPVLSDIDKLQKSL